MTKNFRSADTGRFTTATKAARSPKTTLSETRGGGATGAHRSAETGKFVTPAYAARHPSKTVKES